MSSEELYILGQVLGILVTVGCILASQFPKRWHMLLFSSLCNLLSGCNYFFVTGGRALSVVLSCLVATVHCFVAHLYARRDRSEPVWEKCIAGVLYVAAWAIGYRVPMDFFPLVGTVFFMLSSFAGREQRMRLFSLLNALTYVVYNAILLNSAIFAQIISATSILIALIRYGRRAKAEGKPIL